MFAHASIRPAIDRRRTNCPGRSCAYWSETPGTQTVNANTEGGEQCVGNRPDVAGVRRIERRAVFEINTGARRRASDNRAHSTTGATASAAGIERDFSATITASASGDAAVSARRAGQTVDMPCRTSVLARSVAPVKSSAMQPSNMRISAFRSRAIRPRSTRAVTACAKLFVVPLPPRSGVRAFASASAAIKCSLHRAACIDKRGLLVPRAQPLHQHGHPTASVPRDWRYLCRPGPAPSRGPHSRSRARRPC